jgi:hypothetical protein
MATNQVKRKLSEIDFSGEDSHIALCHKDQGVANKADYTLVLKASKFSDEAVAKFQQVKVTMELPDFLSRFFSIWSDDAEVLAAMMGYVEPVEAPQEEIQDWIQSRMAAFEIIKSAYEAENISDVLTKLDEDEYLSLLKDQVLIEKAFKKIDKLNKAKKLAQPESGKPTMKLVAAQDDSTSASVEKNVGPSGSVNKGKLMTQEIKVIEQEVEVVEKSQFVAVEKLLNEQKVTLEKAMQTIAQLETEKKEAIVKSKTSAISAIVKNEKQLGIILKAALALQDDADFEALVGVVKEMQEQVEKSILFKEVADTAPAKEEVKKSALDRMIEAKFNK